jgi:hypothetical protein
MVLNSSTHIRIGKTFKSLLSRDLSMHANQNVTANVLKIHFFEEKFGSPIIL